MVYAAVAALGTAQAVVLAMTFGVGALVVVAMLVGLVWFARR